MFNIPEKVAAWKPVALIIKVSRQIVLPGFDGVPLYDVARFFIKGLTDGYISHRAAAVSFSFFLAIFPFLILLFTVIPFIPVNNFQANLLGVVESFMPGKAYETVKETIIDIVTRPRSGLLFLNFFLTLYFSTNGVNSMIEAFNNTSHAIETRTKVKQYLISLMLVLIISFLLIISIGLISFGSVLLRFLLPHAISSGIVIIYFVQLLRWMIILGVLLLAISSIYYFAPAKRRDFRFISAGSMLSTLLVVFSTLGFNYYVDNFSRYNVLYGSIGTLMIVLVWVYVNALSVIIGFELNASILNARQYQHAK
jgi:membrane protein